MSCDPALLRLCIMLAILCFLFLMPSLLIYFLGYIPIRNFNENDHETGCLVTEMTLQQKTCSRSCNCHTYCRQAGKYTSCSRVCATCHYTCYYVLETLSVKKVDETFFRYQLVYGDYYEVVGVAQQTLNQGLKLVDTTYSCFYDDRVSPIKVQFFEESDAGYYIATAVVGGIGALCYLIHIVLELYWKWIYRNEHQEKDIEMK